ncbi:MAG: DUF5320 domain-containing protein [Desulfobacterales bacterium]|jgi:hypothetical protein|nr:DUF5320 domain-containing protein [Desulfobacterales bacterium]
MPGYDRTGPWGQGPRTGGGFGYCGPHAQAAEADASASGGGSGFYGRESGRGGRGLQRGSRRGFCFFGRGRGGTGYGPRRYPETIPPNPVRPDLEAEAAALRRRLETIEQRLAGMEVPGESKPA